MHPVSLIFITHIKACFHLYNDSINADDYRDLASAELFKLNLIQKDIILKPSVQNPDFNSDLSSQLNVKQANKNKQKHE